MRNDPSEGATCIVCRLQSSLLVNHDTNTTITNLTHGYVQLDRHYGRLESMQDDHYFEKASWVFFDATKHERYVGSIGALNSTKSPDLDIGSYAHSSIWPRL